MIEMGYWNWLHENVNRDTIMFTLGVCLLLLMILGGSLVIVFLSSTINRWFILLMIPFVFFIITGITYFMDGD